MGLGAINGTYMDTFDLVMFKDTFGALETFPKIRCLQRCFLYTYDSFSVTLLYLFPVTVNTNVTSRNLKFKNIAKRLKFNFSINGKMKTCYKYLGNG